jgi:hypothetical protein
MVVKGYHAPNAQFPLSLFGAYFRLAVLAIAKGSEYTPV